MNGDDFWNLTVLALVLFGCLFFVGRSVWRMIGGSSAGRCSRCSLGKNCGAVKEPPSKPADG